MTAGNEALPGHIQQRLEAIWKQAYRAETKNDLRDLYATWARSYDEDHEAIGYFGHELTARIFAEHMPEKDVPVLDAGAGTGAGGVKLAGQGFEDLTAIDLSPDMLRLAAEKGVFREVHEADLGLPLDHFETDRFGGAILVGVFSYGQAPAHALEEMLRLVRPGGIIAFTMRTDFFEDDPMGVHAEMEALSEAGAWEQVTVTEPAPYLPKKDPNAMFRVWAYRVLEGKYPEPNPDFIDAVEEAFREPGPVKRLDHRFIWDPTASRLYNAYISSEDYYLVDSEEEILRDNAAELVNHGFFVELGCGSARKISWLLEAALEETDLERVTYMPIDVSEGAIRDTVADVRERFGEKISVVPQLGTFDEVLSRIPHDKPKSMFFFGSSIGNIETLEDTVAFLAGLRDKMTPDDRLIVGFDIQKEEEFFLRAYNAGRANRSFFLHMVRRINNELRADFDLEAFRLDSTYEPEPTYREMETRCVNLKVATTKPQTVRIGALGHEVSMKAGDAVQVGTSRKFRTDDIRLLAGYAGLRLETVRIDSRHLYSLAEMSRVESPLDHLER